MNKEKDMFNHEYVGNIHIHSFHSDGRGSYGEIAGIAQRAGLDFICFNDHDYMKSNFDLSEEGFYGNLLVLIGLEIGREDHHYLAFDLKRMIRSDGLGPQDVIDDVDYEIFVHKMNMIAQEGKETTMKLGASSGMRWGDVAFGIYTSLGDLAVVATGIWFHAVLGQLPAKYIVKHWVNEPSVGVKEGDSFFFNDAFYAGVHSADMGLVVPVFYEGKLICFTGAAVHTGECGATDPGGMSNNARTKYEMALRSRL